MIVIELHKYCTTAEVTGSGETFLIPRIQLCLPSPTVQFKRRRRRFPIKIAFAMTTSAAQGQKLKPVAIYLPSSVLFPMASSMWHFLDSLNFITSLFVIIEGHRKRKRN